MPSLLRLALLLVFVCPALAPAQVLLSSGHVDFVDIEILGPTFPQLAINIHDHDNDITYATSGMPGNTDWARMVVVPAAIFPRPASPAFDPIGVPASTDFWWLKNPQNPATLFGGFSAEEVVPVTQIGSYFESDPRVNATARWIKISLVAKQGPGDFSVWTESGGTPTFWMATSDGITFTDAAFILAGGHIDYNFGFTAAGEYELDFVATAFNSSLQPIGSEVTTLQFSVVPEPALASLGVVVSLGIGFARRARQINTVG